MSIEQFRAICNGQPLCPFVVHLAAGPSIPINHLEFVTPSPSGRKVSLYQPDDTLNIIDLLLVTDLEVKPAANGSGRKRKD